MTKAIRDIVEYLYNNHVKQTGKSLEDFLQNKCHMHVVTVQRLLAGKKTNSPTIENLRIGFSACPGCGTLEKDWFYASSLEEFCKLRDAHKFATTKLEAEMPKFGDSLLLKKIAGSYICYRYAFDVS